MRAINIFRLLAGSGAVGGFLLTAGTAHADAVGPAQAVVVPCSEMALVNAVDEANAAGGGDLILAPFCTYTLTGAHSTGGSGGPAGLPNITTPITMTGLATEITRASYAPSFRIIEVDGPSQFPLAHGQLTLGPVTISNGDAGLGVGGGIANLGGSVTIIAGAVRGSHASYGGGIYTDTALTMTASSITGNAASVNGGGIYQNAGSITLLAGNVSGNAPNNCAATAPLTSPC
ncbi:hypothetical protein LN042_36510 [Kitasatospora sp. RB6PN24]|uniref:hypothetical protein n=1 Tax=Kitasatospora humi TaxID=2893891 RepID=UPI001E4EDE42|nr:hypothetical protein [Kitasatospora humi]MCC9312495.1 hypothetical protein [Kitasatospora humi]